MNKLLPHSSLHCLPNIAQAVTFSNKLPFLRSKLMISQFIWELLKLLAAAQYTLIRFYFQSRVTTNPSRIRDPPHLKSREKREGIFFSFAIEAGSGR